MSPFYLSASLTVDPAFLLSRMSFFFRTKTSKQEANLEAMFGYVMFFEVFVFLDFVEFTGRFLFIFKYGLNERHSHGEAHGRRTSPPSSNSELINKLSDEDFLSLSMKEAIAARGGFPFIFN